MQPENNRNLLIFLAVGLLMLVLYQQFVVGPRTAQQHAAAAQQAASQPAATAQTGPATTALVSREQALALSPRIPVETGTLHGSIALRGARFDDLSLRQYHQTTDPRSPSVDLLRPAGATDAFFADFGWAAPNVPGLPDQNTLWQLQGGGALTPQTPVTLTYVSPAGLAFVRTISVDTHYMFTVTNSVTNLSGRPIAVMQPTANVRREGLPNGLGAKSIVHEGAIGVFGDQLHQLGYNGWRRANSTASYTGTGGWLGITDQYWMAVVVPGRDSPMTGEYHYDGPREAPHNAPDTGAYYVRYLGTASALPNGSRMQTTLRFYAGAKEAPLLSQYERGEIASRNIGDARIARFHDGVDWGHFWFITQPVFWVLDWLFRYLGNFGLAILALTVLFKLLFFPLMNMSFESMTKMKKVQPELEALRTRYKDDAPAQQREMMSIYQREKINPFMGCLPVLATIPVFFSLYKVLTVTLEMRHAPFYGVVSDLSARDPTSLWNLFGLLPFNPAHLPLIGGLLDANLHVGFFAIIYGLTMWLSQSMAPQTGMDPAQRRILGFMPLIFTFALSQLAVGLMIYYSWSNILSILQQYVIMRRYKVENPIDSILARFARRPSAAE